MNPLILLPGLAGVLAVLSFMKGYQLLRSDPVKGLEVADLTLIRDAEERRRSQGQGPLDRLADALLPHVRARMPRKAMAYLHRQIDLAGRPEGMTVDTVLKRVAVWIIIAGGLAFALLVSGNLALIPLVALLPVVFPFGRLSALTRKRREQIDKDLPDFLDVLAVTASSGLAFRAALARVAQEFGGPLGEEIMTSLHQIANGASLRGAFLRMKERTNSEPLSEFVTAFLQSEEFGAPLIDALNQIAADMRRESAQAQRRRAAKVAPRVTLVNSLVLVPGVLILLVVGMVLGTGVLDMLAG